MCAQPNTPNTPSTSTKQASTKPEPKWLTLKKKNLSSAGRNAKRTAKQSSSSAQKPNQQSRNEKRARWAKKNKPTAKRPAAPRGPVKEYLCDCHGEPARKPRAGTKVAVQDPESKKMKDKFLGLGKWRCATTGKRCKVTPQAPKPKEVPQPTIGGTVPDIIYPAKLQTPMLVVPPPTEVLDATTAV